MLFREVIWNYSFLSNLLAGFLIMVLTVTLIAYIINWLEKRRTRFVRYNIIEGLRVTIGTLMISLIDVVGFEEPRKLLFGFKNPAYLGPEGGSGFKDPNDEENPAYLGKTNWLLASYSDLPDLWRAALKNTSGLIIERLASRDNLRLLSRIYRKYTQKMKGHARELAPFVSEFGGVIGLLEMISRELELLHLLSELGFKGEAAISQEDVSARRQLVDREQELKDREKELGRIIIFTTDDVRNRELISMSITIGLSKLADLADEVEQHYSRLKKQLR